MSGRWIATGRSAALLGALAVTAAQPAAADDRPPTVPAVRAWTAGGGAVPIGTRVLATGAHRRGLRGEAATLAADLAAATGARVRATARRGARAHRGDVRLELDPAATGLGTEGYRLRVGRAVTVVAPTTAGVFYGGRTVLQLARLGPIPRGSGTDAPRFADRGLMVDTARKYFTPDWLEARIRELADLKLNILHLHLSDDEGFRVESASHPEIVAAQHLTAADVHRLVAEGRRRHVTIVPEIDMPGHFRAALAKHPELQLRDATGTPADNQLDITLPAARRFAIDLVDDMLALFPGPWFHAGGDEFHGFLQTELDDERYPQFRAAAQAAHGPGANARDAVIDFMNLIGDHVRAAGRRLRVWGDGIGHAGAAALDPRTTVEWWENRESPTPADLAAGGHRVLNAGWWPLYFITGGPLGGHPADPREMYEQWQPWVFEGPFTTRITGVPGFPPALTLPAGDPHLAGAQLAVWNDAGGSLTAEQIADGIRPRLRILAQKTWGSAPIAPGYTAFAAAAGRALGDRG